MVLSSHHNLQLYLASQSQSHSSQSFLNHTKLFFGAAQGWFRVGRMSSCHEYSELFFWHFYSSWLICILVFTLIFLSHKCIILHNNPQLWSCLLNTPEDQIPSSISWKFFQVLDSAYHWLSWVNCDDAEDIQSMSMMCWNFSEAIISFNLFLISFLPAPAPCLTLPHWEGNVGGRCNLL